MLAVAFGNLVGVWLDAGQAIPACPQGWFACVRNDRLVQASIVLLLHVVGLIALLAIGRGGKLRAQLPDALKGDDDFVRDMLLQRLLKS
jgi:hypothetical protein